MPQYRILSVPFEILCRHAEDEPTLAEIVEWLREGALEIDINDEDYSSPVSDYVQTIRIDWNGVVESIGRRRSPWRDENDKQNETETTD
jgi:hypothetical protein